MEHKYLCYKRFKGKGLSGDFNIARGEELIADEKFIKLNNQIVCAIRSEVGCNHFVLNDDNRGMERSDLTSSIIKTLIYKDAWYQRRWDKVWCDDIAHTMKRKEYEDMWLWDVTFYQGKIEDLEHILKIIKEV